MSRFIVAAEAVCRWNVGRGNRTRLAMLLTSVLLAFHYYCLCCCCGCSIWSLPRVVCQQQYLNRSDWLQMKAERGAISPRESHRLTLSATPLLPVSPAVELKPPPPQLRHAINDPSNNDQALIIREENPASAHRRISRAPASNQQATSGALIATAAASSHPENEPLVTNTCEREFARVNLKFSEPFYGLIHAKGHRHKALCSLEGEGVIEMELNISLALNWRDPNYCGAFKAGTATAAAIGSEELQQAQQRLAARGKLISLILVVRWSRNIELQDDKFFLLNCTNRCRWPDCASLPTTKLTNSDVDKEVELTLAGQTEKKDSQGGRGGADLREAERGGESSRCNQAAPARLSTTPLVWPTIVIFSLALLLLALLVSNCILCHTFFSRKQDNRPSSPRRTRQKRRELQGEDLEDVEEANARVAPRIVLPTKSQRRRSRRNQIEYYNDNTRKKSNASMSVALENHKDVIDQRASQRHHREQQQQQQHRDRAPRQ